MPMVSVIVPIYKVEKYLTKCVDAIRRQSYRNLQIILVDDGSPDNCPAICDRMAEEDKRIIVIHKQNGGLSDARNAGLDAAIGEFICFCDSDDYIETNTIETAVSAIVKFNCDVVVWGYFADYCDKDDNVVHTEIRSIAKSVYDIKTTVTRDGLFELTGYAWNKLYRREFIGANRFEKGISLVEDVLFNAPLLSKTDNIVFLSDVLTHYMQRTVATLGKRYYKEFFDLVQKVILPNSKLLRYWGYEEKKVENYIRQAELLNVWNTIKNIAFSDFDKKQKKQKTREVLQNAEVKEIMRKSSEKNRNIRLKRILMRFSFPSILIWIITLRKASY